MVPPSRRGKNLPPVSRKEEEPGCPQGSVVASFLTYPGMRPREQAKLGESGQHSGEMGGSSPWTRPSAPGVVTHSRLQRVNSARSRVEIRATWLRGRYRLGLRPVVLLRTETAQCTVKPTIRTGKIRGSLSERSCP